MEKQKRFSLNFYKEPQVFRVFKAKLGYKELKAIPAKKEILDYKVSKIFQIVLFMRLH